MFPIHEVSQIELVFPASVLQSMPKLEDIPDEFRIVILRNAVSQVIGFSVDYLNLMEVTGRG